MARRVVALSLVLALVGCRTAAERRAGEVEHAVSSGETLTAIAKRYQVTVVAVAERNALPDPSRLRIGQRLIIPAPPPPIEAEADAPEEAPPVIEVLPPPKAGEAPPLTWSPDRGQSVFVWPVDGVVVSRFGKREGAQHDGVDIAAPVGTVVWAAASGEVVYAGVQPGYGTIVILRHPDGPMTVYAHNQENFVKEGQQVEQGAPIARVGQSGGATSPGLHFEVRDGRVPVDPLGRLPR